MSKFIKYTFFILFFLFLNYLIIYFFDKNKAKKNIDDPSIRQSVELSENNLKTKLNDPNNDFFDKVRIFFDNISDVIFIFFTKNVYPVFSSLDNDFSIYILNQEQSDIDTNSN